MRLYSGNPLALKIVAETIVDLFGGEIGLFLAGGTLIFGSITDLLDEQFARLSALEQSVLCWLAIAREPVTLDELQALLVAPMSAHPGARSRREPASTLPDRAWETSGQLHVAIGGAGVCDGGPDCRGKP